VLRPVQEIFSPSDYPDLLVGLSGPDDAAVWRLDESRALVVTTDFFTPIVDDPRAYGAIAAANSLSDVYAMGGKPFLALNIAALPEDLPAEVTREILLGGAEKAREAGVVIAGGHTIKDREPKYGLVVIGFVESGRMLRKAGLKVGDTLVLTKPLGLGLTTTALKRDEADAKDIEEAISWMSRLNRVASELATEFGLQAGTDVTGYGLAGHGLEMAQASKVALRIEFDNLPLLTGTRKYARMGAFAGGLLDNRSYFGPSVQIGGQIAQDDRMILFDPQTSGGLLLAVPQGKLAAFSRRAAERGQDVWIIGDVRAGEGIRVE
jgi:selenide, water dikinase